jgi:hypothetical protein
MASFSLRSVLGKRLVWKRLLNVLVFWTSLRHLLQRLWALQCFTDLSEQEKCLVRMIKRAERAGGRRHVFKPATVRRGEGERKYHDEAEGERAWQRRCGWVGYGQAP